MRKSVAAATVAASVLAGGAFGAVLGAPGLAGAQEAGAAAVSWVDEALSGLVSDGTITQDQADAVEAALEEAKPARAFGFVHHLEAAAEALGITTDELRTELQAGKSLATIAGEQGVSVDSVVDALVAEHSERLDEAVAAGKLTQEDADARKAEVEERVTAMVNGELPAFGGGRGRGFGGPGHRVGPWGADEAAA